MSYTLHPGAEQDVADALDFYLERVPRAVRPHAEIALLAAPR